MYIHYSMYYIIYIIYIYIHIKYVIYIYADIFNGVNNPLICDVNHAQIMIGNHTQKPLQMDFYRFSHMIPFC